MPIIVERSMWWPGPQAATWQEAHNSAGAPVTGTRWAVADLESGGTRNARSDLPIANASGMAGTVRVTFHTSFGASPPGTWRSQVTAV